MFDYKNVKYNKLTITSVFMSNKSKFKRCLAICECGKEKEFELQAVKRGLTKSCGCLNSQAASKRRKGKIIKSKYKYNEDFFDSITSNSAYVLGLIYSDGCLEKGTNMFKITLNERDDYLLKAICMLIRNDPTIYVIKGLSIACFTNKRLYESLLKLGIYPNKSKTLCIHDSLVTNKDFWRGMIDGDGSLYWRNGSLLLSLCGTKSVVSSFRHFCLSNNITSKSNVSVKKGYTFDFSSYTICGQNAFKIASLLYENSFLKLSRKYDNLKLC